MWRDDRNCLRFGRNNNKLSYECYKKREGCITYTTFSVLCLTAQSSFKLILLVQTLKFECDRQCIPYIYCLTIHLTRDKLRKRLT